MMSQSNHCGMEISAVGNEMGKEFHVSIEPLWNGNDTDHYHRYKKGYVSIEPLWNGNMDLEKRLANLDEGLNRTIVEWKLSYQGNRTKFVWSLNRTIVEWKYGMAEEIAKRLRRLNRTIVEWKLK